MSDSFDDHQAPIALSDGPPIRARSLFVAIAIIAALLAGGEIAGVLGLLLAVVVLCLIAFVFGITTGKTENLWLVFCVSSAATLVLLLLPPPPPSRNTIRVCRES